MCFHLLWTESAYGGHNVSHNEANQWHQHSHTQNIRCEDHPDHAFDGKTRQDGHDDAGDDQDAETSLTRTVGTNQLAVTL